MYIGDCKQNMTVISSNKKVSVRCSVLRLCSKHRRVRELTNELELELGSPALMLEPLEFVSGECSSNMLALFIEE